MCGTFCHGLTERTASAGQQADPISDCTMRAQACLAKAEQPRPVDSMSIFCTLDQQRQGTGVDTSKHIRSAGKCTQVNGDFAYKD